MEHPVHRQAGEIAFGDTDASGWMHFPNIFKYVEAAEHAYLRKKGILVFHRAEGGWPRVKVTCDYKRPLTCGEKIETRLSITRMGASSIAWDFEVANAAGEIAAFGSMTTVRVNAFGKPMEITAAERSLLLGENS